MGCMWGTVRSPTSQPHGVQVTNSRRDRGREWLETDSRKTWEAIVRGPDFALQAVGTVFRRDVRAQTQLLGTSRREGGGSLGH